MSTSSLEMPCPSCGAYMGWERVFCLKCGYRLIPITQYDLETEDFVYPPDREGLNSLRQFRVLVPIIREFIIRDYVGSMSSWLSKNAIKIDFSSGIGSAIMECGLILGLKSLPRAYLLPDKEVNAFTFGSDDVQFLVLTSGLLKSMTGDEVKAALAHELGHIRCDHVIYHTLAELLVRGVEFSSRILGASLEAISPIFKLILLSWRRESEVSADRASLLVVGDLDVIKSMFTKLSPGLIVDEEVDLPHEKAASSLLEAFNTHPTLRKRMMLLRKFYRSPEYEKAREKIAARLKLRGALVPRCKFCGSAKPLTDMFCPTCGRSLI
ncbi:MAG: M48 family metallopeptidase [Nitrososphaerota archaeon]|nr:M48 family metallopeptidase [Nitrososphaerota archaeon]